MSRGYKALNKILKDSLLSVNFLVNCLLDAKYKRIPENFRIICIENITS